MGFAAAASKTDDGSIAASSRAAPNHQQTTNQPTNQPTKLVFPLELGEKKDRPIGPSNLKPKRGHSCSCCCQDGCTSGHVQVGSRPVLDFAAVSLLCRWVKPVQAVISVLASGLQQGDV